MKTNRAGAARRLLGMALAAAVVALAATGCGSSDDDKGSTAASGGSALAQAVPQDVRDRGYLRVAVFDGNLPWHAFDSSQQAIGADPEVIAAIARELELDVRFEAVDFAGQIPGVQAGRYDMMANVTNLPERREVLRFIDKSHEYNGVLVPQGNPQGIETLEDLCGKRVAALSGSTTVAALEDVECPSGEVEIIGFTTPSDALLASSSGRADAVAIGLSASRYGVEHAEGKGVFAKLEVAPVTPFTASVNGFAVAKDNAELQDAIQQGFDAVVESGEDARILKQWGVDDLALDATGTPRT